MALEELTQYVAYCSGPSDLADRCPEGSGPFEDPWGDDSFDDEMHLVRELQKAGWYIELTSSGYPRKYAEVMCPKCKEVAGE
jgi:hypothetical protein